MGAGAELQWFEGVPSLDTSMLFRNSSYMQVHKVKAAAPAAAFV